MIRLPVYERTPLLIESTVAKPHDRTCMACERSSTRAFRCLLPGQRKGSGRRVLVLASRVGRDDAQRGQLATGGATQFLYNAAVQFLEPDAHLLIDAALRCAGDPEDEREVAACRAYTAQVVQSFRPDLILACGSAAVRSLTGAGLDVRAAARGWTTTSAGVPVVVMLDELYAWGNAFLQGRFLADLEWALRRPMQEWASQPWERVAVTDAEVLSAALAELRAAEWVAWDVEASGLPFDGDTYFEVLSHGLAAGDSQRVYTWDRAALRRAELAEPLYQLLEDPTVAKVGQNLKADCVYMAAPEPWTGRRKVFVQNVWLDIKLVRHLQDPDVDADLATLSYLVGRGETKGVLDEQLELAGEWVRHVRKKAATGAYLPGTCHPAYDAAVKHPKRGHRFVSYGLVDQAAVVQYQATDVATTAEMARRELAIITADPVVRAGWEVIRPLPEVAARMESTGMQLDLARLDSFQAWLQVRQQSYERQLYVATGGRTIQHTSDDAVADYLYGTLGLEPQLFTDTRKPSVSEDALTPLIPYHPSVSIILALHECSKFLGTYCRGLRRHVRGDGRIHPTFNLDGTRTGRWSSSDPNFQNIANHGDLAKMLKRAFVARPGYKLVALDFKQLEYVVASIVSGDPAMQQIFRDGKDMHRRTAELLGPILYGTPVADMERLSKDEIADKRQAAKSVNFGALFNMQATTLARQIGCSDQEAAKVLNAILYDLFPTYAAWRKRTIDEAMRSGIVHVFAVGANDELYPIRRRPLVGLGSHSKRAVGNAINASVNTPVQGSASVIANRAITAVDRWLREQGLYQRGAARLNNAIHDAIYLEVEDSLVAAVAPQVGRLMIDQPSRGVPLAVDITVGPDLASMIPYDDWMVARAAA